MSNCEKCKKQSCDCACNKPNNPGAAYAFPISSFIWTGEPISCNGVVVNTGDPIDQALAAVILRVCNIEIPPQGEQGIQGIQGIQGDPGPQGPAGTIPAVPDTVTCGRFDVYEEGDSFDTALAKVVEHFCGINNTFVSIEYSDLLTAIEEATLLPGALYEIADRGIFLQALSNNMVASEGHRVMRIIKSTYYVPSGTVLGVWNSNLTPTTNDVTIWGGRVWQNLNGNVGAATDDITLDSEWVLLPTSNSTYYESKVFGCVYDLTNDWVAKQWDDRGNVFSCSKTEDVEVTGFGIPVIDISDWGNNEIFGNICMGVFNNVGKVGSNKVDRTIFRNISDVLDNINVRSISDNVCSSIEENRNVLEISYNNIPGSIQKNRNNGLISGCSNNGDIKYNTNNGSIIGIGAANDNIQYNTNNGDITTTTTGDISDPIVNK